MKGAADARPSEAAFDARGLHAITAALFTSILVTTC